MRLPIAIAVAACLTLGAGASRAARPWRPDVHVPATERLGRRLAEPGPEQLARFSKTLERARLMFSHGKYEKARAELLRAVDIYPEHVGGLVELARVSLTLGYLNWDYDLVARARENARHAMCLAPGDETARLLDTMSSSLMKRMRPSRKKKH